MPRVSYSLFYFFWLLILSFNIAVSYSWAFSNDDCKNCHAKTGYDTRLHVDLNRFYSSVHGKILNCIDCHHNIADDNHSHEKSTSQVDCTRCHEQENVHDPEGSLKCADCHTNHYIYKATDIRSSLSPENMVSTCGKCHAKIIAPINGSIKITPEYCR